MLTIVTPRPGESVYNQRETTLNYKHFIIWFCCNKFEKTWQTILSSEKRIHIK